MNTYWVNELCFIWNNFLKIEKKALDRTAPMSGYFSAHFYILNIRRLEVYLILSLTELHSAVAAEKLIHVLNPDLAFCYAIWWCV